MYVLVCALMIHFFFIYLFSIACPQTHLYVFFAAGAATRKAVETGTRLRQTPWSSTGRLHAAPSLCVWTRERVSERVSDQIFERLSGWAGEAGEQTSSLLARQTAQLGWLASYSPQCGNGGWLPVSGRGASFPGTCAPRGGHHLDGVCSITGGSITRGSCWENT